MNFVQAGTLHIHKNVEPPPPGGPEWSDLREVHLDNCTCDLHVHLTGEDIEDKPDFIARRVEDGKHRDVRQMVLDICTQISSCWTIDQDGNMLRNVVDSPFYTTVEAIRGRLFQNAFALNPISKGHTAKRNKDLSMHKDLLNMYQQWDLKIMSKFYPRADRAWMTRNVWQTVKFDATYYQGISWEPPKKVLPLVVLAARACSHFNATLGGGKYGPNAMFSLTDMFPKKYLKDTLKMDKPTHRASPQMVSMSHILAPATKLLYAMTGWDKMIGKKKFVYEPQHTIPNIYVPMGTSAGFCPGPRVERWVIPDKWKIVYHKVGKKMEQAAYARTQIADVIKQAYEGPVTIPETYMKISEKAEVHFGNTDAEKAKFSEKVRQFWISSTTSYIASAFVNGYRSKLERGVNICIGMNWNHGGAQHLLEYHKWRDLNRCVEVGDFKGYDKGIKAYLENIFTGTASVYYSREGPDIKMFLRMVDAVAADLAVKRVQVIADVWMMVIGVMASGRYETSHGDSYINMFMYCMFIVHTAYKHVAIGPKLLEEVRTGQIAYSVYGDDNVHSYHQKWYKYINIWERKKFFMTYFSVVMRDCKVFRSRGQVPAFITSVDPKTSRMTFEGPSFLQHYFVLRSEIHPQDARISDVLPFRTTLKTVRKFAFGDGSPRIPIDYVMAAIGHAYDTKGNNNMSYDFCLYAYRYWFKRMGCSWSEVRSLILSHKATKGLQKLYHKCNINEEVLAQGFPTLSKLRSLHIYDETCHKNYAREHHMQLDEEEIELL